MDELAELKTLFVVYELGDECADVCAELGVKCVDDLEWIRMFQIERLRNVMPVPKQDARAQMISEISHYDHFCDSFEKYDND